MNTNSPDQKNNKLPARLLKPDEVAAYLNISRSFSYHLLQMEVIPVVRMGKALRVRSQDLDAYIEKNLHHTTGGI